ncbi:MAG: nicotinamide riboside transporter PnuC [Terracidiphilus sp.]|nr:nicotinamide riboside transporter PnuC [Terracidiphilus sp.]
MSWTTIANYLSTNWLENVAAVITLVGIWLTTRRTLICWPVVLISDVLYLIVFHQENLKSDAYLQIFFIGFTLYSWWNWARGARVDGEVRVVPMHLKDWLAGLLVGALGSIVVGWWMTRIGAALPHLDATLAVFSLVASWWEARKHTANWWLWIVVDTVYVGEYLYKGMWTTAALYAGFVALAILGLKNWKRALSQASESLAVATTASS